MALLADFLPEVYALTGRPDLVVETTAALQRALRQCHFYSWFDLDLQLEEYAYAGDAITTEDLPERFRKVHAVNGGDFELKEIPAAAIFDPYVFVEKRNVWYLTGSGITFRTERAWTMLTMLFFQTPDWEDSFIANDEGYKIAIHYKAAAKIFALLEQDKLLQYYEQLGTGILNEIKQAHLAL